VDARVLDPRPDTETLVDWALEAIAPLPAPRVADLGTGSGAIALALQSQRPTAQVLAVDASADALAVAQANASGWACPCAFQHGNWLHGVEGVFDAIVSNPPYIASADPHLAALTHEPLQALASGPTGWTTSAPSWPRRLARLAAGRLAAAGTRPRPGRGRAGLLAPTGLRRCKAAMTLPASRAVRAGSGRQ
jgi:release factor glutamine methyltransferase